MKNYVYIFFMALSVLSACTDNPKVRQPLQKQLSVFVTIAPQKSIVQAIGGKYVAVKVMVPPGKEPHDYTPSPKQILDLHKARIYFEIGMPFEKVLLEKVKGMQLDTSFIYMQKNTERHITYVNNRKVVDPHIWLSQNNLKILSKNTLKELIKLMPLHKKYFLSNYDTYIRKLNEVNKKLAATLAPFKGKAFLVFHPAFGYFATDFGLIQKSVEIEGKESTPKELLNLISKAKHSGVKVIFVEPQFSKKSAHALAKAINGTVISIDPLAEDVLKNLQTIAVKIKNSFKTQD